MSNNEYRAPQQAAREAGLARRHETREARAIRRQVAEEIAQAIDDMRKALNEAYAQRGHEADGIRADLAVDCMVVARLIGTKEPA